MAGYVKLHRGWRDCPVLQGGEFSRADAWLWLIENACWKKTPVRIKGDTIKLERGELTFSVRFLASTWGWSKSRVDRFLADLRAENMVKTRSKIGTTAGHNAGQGQSIITICNYNKYQDDETPSWDNGVQKSGQERDKEEEGKKEEKKEDKGSRALILPDWLPTEGWMAYLEMRKAIRKPMTDHAKRLAISRLNELRRSGSSPGDVLNQSIMNSWQGLFEVKADERRVVVGI